LLVALPSPRVGVSTHGPTLLTGLHEENNAQEELCTWQLIPDTAKEKPQEGVVIAVGPGRFDDGVRVPMDVKVGDVVLYSKYGGTEIKHGGDDLLVLSARDILAVIEK